MDFKEIREASGMSQVQFSREFNIPIRTVQSWEYGERQCPEYVLELIRYKLDAENGEEKTE